ncbi:hypothetical protein GYA54_00050 [Candidatus Kuenenbacteria bacterium]|nr:hypothetical protein [Candidatus Kuenenbacteria bacterium]
MHLENTKRGSRLKKNFLTIIIVVLIYFLFASPFVFGNTPVAEAYKFTNSLGNLAQNAGLTSDPSSPPVQLPTLIGRIIYYALGMVGVVFLILTIIAGLKWMLAGGNEEAVSKAKKAILDASLGVLVVLASYAITYFIVTIVK